MYRLYAVLLLIPVLSFSAAQSALYPQIPGLESKDTVFKQFEQDRNRAYQSIARGNGPIVPYIYTYTAAEEDSLMTIAARCNIPYETIATLNRIPDMQTPVGGKTLYLSSAPGLFIAENPENDIELLLASSDRDENASVRISIQSEKGETLSFLFYPDRPAANGLGLGKLSPTERAFFLDSRFRFPLPEGIKTSVFGMRCNPVTGNMVFHKGVDIAAPEGTLVFASREGTVIETAYDPIYGNHVIIRHDNGAESLSGHLKHILVENNIRVNGGSTIGTVGSTGQSTGFHLHFEIRVNGAPQDPVRLLNSAGREKLQ